MSTLSVQSNCRPNNQMNLYIYSWPGKLGYVLFPPSIKPLLFVSDNLLVSSVYHVIDILHTCTLYVYSFCHPPGLPLMDVASRCRLLYTLSILHNTTKTCRSAYKNIREN